MSKKALVILILVILVLPLLAIGGYFFFRNSDVPIGETISGILPFGSGDNLPPATNNTENLPSTNEENNSNEIGAPKKLLFQISQTPVSGAIVLNKSSSTSVRYVDRATGHIYDVNLETLEKTKVTNQTLPKIYEAYFRGDGNTVLLRSLKDDSDTVENLSLALTPPSSKISTSSPEESMLYSASSTVLRGEIGSVAVSGNTLFYVLKDASSIVSSAFNGTGLQTLLTSPFKDWRIAVGGNVTIYTKASSNASGYAYTLNASGGLTRLLGPLNGLTALPSVSGNKVLYSYNDKGETRLFAKNTANGNNAELSAPTFAEKCVWSKFRPALVYCGSPSNEIGVNEPDNWYKGVSSFSDRIWSFDTDLELAEVLIEPRAILGAEVDVLRPMLSPNEDYFVFINKIDLSLWALKLGEE